MSVELIADGYRITRKAHKCFDCCHMITKGTRVYFQTCKYDGVYTLYQHLDCREASLHHFADAYFYDYDDGFPGLQSDFATSGEYQVCIDGIRGHFPHVACRLEFWSQKREANHD